MFKIFAQSLSTGNAFLEEVKTTFTVIAESIYVSGDNLKVLENLQAQSQKLEKNSRNALNLTFKDRIENPKAKKFKEQLEKINSKELKDIAFFIGKLHTIYEGLAAAKDTLSIDEKNAKELFTETPFDLGIISTVHPTIWLRESGYRLIGRIQKVYKYLQNEAKYLDPTHPKTEERNAFIKTFNAGMKKEMEAFVKQEPRRQVKPSFPKLVLTLSNSPLKNQMGVAAELSYNSALNASKKHETDESPKSTNSILAEIKRFAKDMAPGSWGGFDCDGASNVSKKTLQESAQLWGIRNLGYQRDQLNKVKANLPKGKDDSVTPIIQKLEQTIASEFKKAKTLLESDIEHNGGILSADQLSETLRELEMSRVDILGEEFITSPDAASFDITQPDLYRAEIDAIFQDNFKVGKDTTLNKALGKAVAMATANGFFGIHAQRREEVTNILNASLDFIRVMSGQADTLDFAALDETSKEAALTEVYRTLSAVTSEQLDDLKSKFEPDTYRQIEQLMFLKDQFDRDPKSVKYHVLSMFRTPSDYLAAMSLFKISGLSETTVTPLPLFEMPDDLENAVETIKTLTQNAAVQEFLPTDNSGKQVLRIQLAHSDSTRTSGIFAKARHFLIRKLVFDAQKKGDFGNIKIKFFDGGGGSLGRGGDKAIYMKALSNLPKDLNKDVYSTHQGEEQGAFSKKASTEAMFSQHISGKADDTTTNFDFTSADIALFETLTSNGIANYRGNYFSNPDLMDTKTDVFYSTKQGNLSARPAARPQAASETQENIAKRKSPILDKDINQDLKKWFEETTVKIQTATKERKPLTESKRAQNAVDAKMADDFVQKNRTIGVMSGKAAAAALPTLFIGAAESFQENLAPIKESLATNGDKSIFNHPYVKEYIFGVSLLILAQTDWNVFALNCSQTESGEALFELTRESAQKMYGAIKEIYGTEDPLFSDFFKEYETHTPTKSSTNNGVLLSIISELRKRNDSQLADVLMTRAVPGPYCTTAAKNLRAKITRGMKAPVGNWG